MVKLKWILTFIYIALSSVGVIGLVACVSTSTTPSRPTPSATFVPTLVPTSIPTSVPTLVTTPFPTLVPRVEQPLFEAQTLADVALVRGPYLQSVTTDSVVVAWETDRPSPGEVVVHGKDEATMRASPRTLRATAITSRHAVTLYNLAPYTAYRYQVGVDGVPLSREWTFRTAAGPESGGFSFVVFGDTRAQHHIHREIVAGIVATAPDFVIHTGDLVTNGGDPQEWEAFFSIEETLMAQAPLFPALGNHEEASTHYFDVFYLPGNERWYTFDYGEARFICLQVDGIADIEPGSAQYEWLEDVLASNARPWLFVYFHIPPYSSVEYSPDVRRTLPPLFETYSVDVVFNGDAHSYERIEVGGVTYVVTAGGGAPLYDVRRPEPASAAYAYAYHFVHLAIEGRRLRATAISDTDEVIDTFERDVTPR